MSISPQTYIPCLLWKQGEYLALQHLSETSKSSLYPLFEIPEIGFDFERKQDSKTIDEHLHPFAKRVRKYWAMRPCMIDIHYLLKSRFMADGQSILSFIFSELRNNSIKAIPVMTINWDSQLIYYLLNIIRVDQLGIALRVNVEEAARPNISGLIQKLLENIDLSPKQCDLILDLGAPNFEPLSDFSMVVLNIIMRLPVLSSWRSFTIMGTSFPPNMGSVNQGQSILPRYEWQLYKNLVPLLRIRNQRIPNFGDYAICNPDHYSGDMRILKTSASIRYTINDKWLIEKGKNLKKFGYDQYRDLCRSIVESRYYFGEKYSYGDAFIFDCANNHSKTGNPTTWRHIGTNHHIEMVIRDVANYYAS